MVPRRAFATSRRRLRVPIACYRHDASPPPMTRAPARRYYSPTAQAARRPY